MRSIASTNMLLKCPEFYDLYMTCHTHGWKMLAPYQWLEQENALLMTMYAGEDAVDVRVRQRDSNLKIEITSRGPLTPEHKANLRFGIRRALDLDTDTTSLYRVARKQHASLAKLVRAGAGRLLKCPSLWEDAVKTLFTTNCSWNLTLKVAAACCAPPFARVSPAGRYPFPKPSDIQRYTPEQLRKRIPIGYRAQAMCLLARRFSRTEVDLEPELLPRHFEEAYKTVRSWYGFGDYAASHVLVLEGKFHKIPVDTVVIDFVRSQYQRNDVAACLAERFDTWGEYKWWGMKLESMVKRTNWLGD